MTFEQFLKDAMRLGNIDFRVRCTSNENLDSSEYLSIRVRPVNQDGPTKEFVVSDNEVIEPEEEDEDQD